MAINFVNNPKVGDNVKIEVGDSSDLQIYHDTTDSYITNTTGDLTISNTGANSDDLILKSADDFLLYVQGTELAIQAVGNSGVILRHNNVVKFETTSTGVDVSGAIVTNLASEGTYFTGGSGDIRQLSITSGTNTSAHALHTFNINSSNGKYKFDINGTEEFSINSGNATFAGNVSLEDANTPTLSLKDTTNNLVARFRAANSYAYITVDHADTVGSSRLVFQVDNTTSLYLDHQSNAIFENGNVGIGTTSATNKLTISDNSAQILLIDTSTSNKGEIEIGDADFTFNLDRDGGISSGKFAWRIDDTTRMELGLDSGDLGQLRLNEYGSGNITGTATQLLGVDENGYIIETSTSGGGTVTGTGTATRVAFWSGTSALSSDSNLYWDNTNNRLGIGTATPAKKLDVQVGTANDDGIVIKDENGNVRTDLTLAGSAGVREGRIKLIDNSGNTNVQIHSDTTSYFNGGNVGIGTTSPGHKLDVNHGASAGAGITTVARFSAGTGSSSGDGTQINLMNWNSHYGGFIRTVNTQGTPSYLNPRLEFGLNYQNYLPADMATKMVILGTGNVGIGTAAPQEELEVKSTSFSTVAVNTDRNTSGENIGSFAFYGKNNATTPENLLYSRIMGSMSDVTDGSEDGDIYFQQIKNGSIAETFRVKSSGNVGIGVTNPSSTLTILGANSAAGGITLTSSTSNSIQKVGRIKTQHYNTAEEPFTAIVTNAQSNANLINIGGSSGGENAATIIKFFTAANNTTLTGSERMRIDSSGNVGIGTTNVRAKLDVQGQIRSTSNIVSNSGYDAFYIGSSRTIDDYGGLYKNYFTMKLQTPAGAHAYGDLRFQLANSTSTTAEIDVMTLRYTGNVGIGTTSPDSILHIYQNTSDTSSSAGLTIEQDGAGDAVVQYLLTGNRRWVAGVDNSDSDRFKFASSSNVGTDTVVTINTAEAGGNVGIGTTSPANKLHVVEGTGNWEVADFQSSSTTGAGITLTPANISSLQWSIIGQGTSGGANDNNLGFHLTGVGTSGGSAGYKMTLQASSGNLGIGTTSPNETLSLYKSDRPYIQFISNTTGTTSSDGSFIGFATADGFLEIRNKEAQPIRLSTSDTERMRITSAGELQLTQSNAEFDFTSSSSSGYKTTFNMDDTGLDIGHNSAVRALNLQTNSSDRLTITGSGNVGIGTTSPSSMLTVVNNSNILSFNEHGSQNVAELKLIGDTAHDTAFYFGDAADTVRAGFYYDVSANQLQVRGYNNGTYMAVSSNGRIGIGTTSPEQKLHVKASDATAIIKIEGGNSVVTAIGEINSRLEFGSNDSSVNSSGNVGGSIESVTEHSNGAITGLAFSTFYQSRTPNDLAEAMRITGSGNVGIGTTSPAEKLDVAGNIHLSANQAYISFNTSASSGHPKIQMESDGDFSFLNTAGASSMIIENGGDVGIGSTAPTSTLTVGSTTDNQTFSLGQRSSGNQSGRTVLIEGVANTGNGEGSGRIFFTEHNSTEAGSNLYGVALTYSGDTSPQFPSGSAPGIGNAKWALMIHNNNLNGQTVMYGSRDDRNVNFANNLYIPNAILHSGDTDTYLQFNGADSWRVVAGNVERLLVNTTSNTVRGSNDILRIQSTSTTGNPQLSFYQTTTRRSFIQHHDSNDNLLIVSEYGGVIIKTGTGGTETEKMRIQADGNVGIGTTNPAELLNVNKENAESVVLISRGGSNVTTSTDIGKIKFSADYDGNIVEYGNIKTYSNSLSAVRSSMDFNVKSTAGNIITGMTVYGTSSGVNVGIGTSAPSKPLTVQGIIRAVGDTSSADFYSTGNDALVVNNGNGNLKFWNNASERMRINSSGSVGIGTTTPGTVNGTAFGGVMLHAKGSGNIGRLVLEGAVQGTMLMNATGSTANQRLKFIQSKQNEFRMGKVSDSGTETTQLAIDDAGDVILQAAGKGLVLVSPNGTTYRLSVTNDGELETTLV